MRPTSVARWVRSRARPVGDAASVTKRSGRRKTTLQGSFSSGTARGQANEVCAIMVQVQPPQPKKNLVIITITRFSSFLYVLIFQSKHRYLTPTQAEIVDNLYAFMH